MSESDVEPQILALRLGLIADPLDDEGLEKPDVRR
jgi:hypothetical protein